MSYYLYINELNNEKLVSNPLNRLECLFGVGEALTITVALEEDPDDSAVSSGINPSLIEYSELGSAPPRTKFLNGGTF